MNCTACGKPMDPGARFCSHCGAALFREPVYPVYPASDRLIRPREGRMIAGVCAGFALRFGWEVTIVRLIVAVAVLVGCGSPLLAYLVAWIVIPNGPFAFPAAVSPVIPQVPPADTQTGATI